MWICDLRGSLERRRRAWARGPVTRRARSFAAAVLALALAHRSASAQGGLGSQREGTSSATFLRIGVGARAQGMGGTFVAVADDPSAIFWNPAGLASLQTREVAASHVDWPSQVNYDHVTLVLPSRRLGGSIGLQFGVLATHIQETTDLQPFGTGNEFTYSDVVAGASFARRWTDKLLVGAGAKFVREDLGSQVGGPVTNAVLFDAGSIFYLGLGSIRIAAALTNFGPEMRPSGRYVSPYTGEQREYDGFDPPMTFRFGAAFEPIETATQRVTTSLEMGQPADNQLQIKGGVEWSYHRMFALRTGYNANADLMRFSAGAGFIASFGTLRGSLDYAYTDAGDLGAVHRMSLGVRF
ncbi:MAG: PorV/PorQ family protein [Candidatus Eisenbacteria bacterium]|uniref:PorV/PorQ family protein n=1 Tax=Eiseniibacteriota bacterium TaxID=2212470 RepID=A0A538U9Z3_UNCEI|nr:MAG: PorV/PorQ family protein [Candidatus Eisenbacteria bacterium]